MQSSTRREFLRTAGGAGILATLAPRMLQAAPGNTAKRPNIVLIVADDMNFDAAGCYGCPIKDLTPNLDRLAGEGIRFVHAYSTVAVCQPVRQIMHTGMYPHRNGAMGFMPLRPDVRTMNQQLHDAGYLISMTGGKHPHYQPFENFCVDFSRPQNGRHPSKLAEVTKEFVALAKREGKSFFHHVNCNDPHRPFIGSGRPDNLAGGEEPSRWIKPAEVTGVPGFLEDLGDIRRELAQYYTSVRRLDDCVGAVLKALDESGARENTLVMFYGGDHGMPLPFAKTNNYENSSRGGLILRWPGVIRPGSVDERHMVSTIDFAPTLLDAAGAAPLKDIDGRSFLPALKGQAMDGWDRVFTFYGQTSGRLWLHMRCIRTRDRAYIWNAWSDGKTQYRAENMAGLSWKAMVAAADTNAEIRKRVEFYLYRVPEEFYDLTGDRCERTNLIADPARRGEIDRMRQELVELLRRTGDPLGEALARRDSPEALQKARAELETRYDRGPRPGKKDKKDKKTKRKD